MENTEIHTLELILQKVAEHFEVEGVPNFSFRKRKLLLEKLKVADEKAWGVTNGLAEGWLLQQRILTDKEKQQKNPDTWARELETAKARLSRAAEGMGKFFKDQGISAEGISLAVFST